MASRPPKTLAARVAGNASANWSYKSGRIPAEPTGKGADRSSLQYWYWMCSIVRIEPATSDPSKGSTCAPSIAASTVARASGAAPASASSYRTLSVATPWIKSYSSAIGAANRFDPQVAMSRPCSGSSGLRRA